MDKNSVNQQDYFGAVSALQKYDDLSCVTNGPAFLIEVCRAYIENSGDKKEFAFLEKVLTERGFVFTNKGVRHNKWADPRDGITAPQTSA